jgi:methoxymalonate biosynthesis protein
VITTLDSRGVLQSITSKNDHDLAWKRLEDLGIAEYFIHPRIGWGRKSDSVCEIAGQLNLALNTIAFIDDMPAERAEVAFRAPEVRCYQAGQAAALPGLAEFSPPVVTVGARRRQMYRASFRRAAARESSAGPDEEFPRSLDLVMTIKRAGEDDLSRVAELTVRTSQMDATGVHYPDAVTWRPGRSTDVLPHSNAPATACPDTAGPPRAGLLRDLGSHRPAEHDLLVGSVFI